LIGAGPVNISYHANREVAAEKRDGQLKMDKAGAQVNGSGTLTTAFVNGVKAGQIEYLEVGDLRLRARDLRANERGQGRILNFLKAVVKPLEGLDSTHEFKALFSNLQNADTPAKFLDKLYTARKEMKLSKFWKSANKKDVQILTNVDRQLHKVFKWMGTKLKGRPTVYREIFGNTKSKGFAKYRGADQTMMSRNGRIALEGRVKTLVDSDIFKDDYKYGEQALDYLEKQDAASKKNIDLFLKGNAFGNYQDLNHKVDMALLKFKGNFKKVTEDFNLKWAGDKVQKGLKNGLRKLRVDFKKHTHDIIYETQIPLIPPGSQ